MSKSIYVKNLINNEVHKFNSRQKASKFLKVSGSSINNYLKDKSKTVVCYHYLINSINKFRDVEDAFLDYETKSYNTIVIAVKKNTTDIILINSVTEASKYFNIDPRSILYYMKNIRPHNEYDLYNYTEFKNIYKNINWKKLLNSNNLNTIQHSKSVIDKYIKRTLIMSHTIITDNQRRCITSLDVDLDIALDSLEDIELKFKELIKENISNELNESLAIIINNLKKPIKKITDMRDNFSSI